MIGLKAKIISVLCAALLFLICFESTGLKASSADIVISSDSVTYRLGDTFTVDLLLEAEVLPGDFEAYVLYSNDILEFVPGAEIMAGGEGIIRISDHVTASTRNTRKYSLKFKAIAVGEAVISLREGAELYEFEEGYLMSLASGDFKINILPVKNASKDNSLAVLKVSPGTLDPVFSPEKKEYRVTVPENTERLTVSAAATDRNATVEVTGNENLLPGTNRVEVTVTAESGDEDVYVIFCEKGGSEEKTTPTETPEITESITEKKDDPDNNISTGTEKAPDEKEYVITPENEGTKALTDSVEALELRESYEKSLSTMTLIIALLSAVSMALLIVVIRLATRKNNDELDD